MDVPRGRSSPAPSAVARFDDAVAGTSLVFPEPDRVLVASTVAEVAPLLRAVDEATREGAWAFGYLSYEAAAGLEATSAADSDPANVPLACFAVATAPRREPLVARPDGDREYWCSAWHLDATREQHSATVLRVQSEIAAGNIYQANLTSRARARVRGDLGAMYADLVHAQHASYNALLDFGDFAVLSISPELFFEWSPQEVWCRPMKGTARRGRSAEEDDLAAARLSASTKDVAENVMIVDLVRNDLGRIARTGTVRVSRLCTREPFGPVWQLSSDVVCEPRADVALVDVVAALFPSGSITGAPKHAAIRLIDELERAPRGVYCGAIGWVAPPDQPTRARFNVAIRTVVVDRASSAAVYGAGGGITTASDPALEYQEMLDKVAVLAATQDAPELELLETLAYVRGEGFRHLDRHLARLARSAAYFGFRVDANRVPDLIRRAVGHREQARVRLVLRENGDLAVTAIPLPETDARLVRVAVDTQPVRSDSLWQKHKTNRRSTYHAALRRHPAADDVLMINEHGNITETTIANVAVRFGNNWYTPPLESGCLPGIARAVALDANTVTERTVAVDDVYQCDALALISSVRGWRTATIPVTAY